MIRCGLGDNNFINLFARLVASSNADRDCDEWKIEGVNWLRECHVHWAPLSFQIETYRLSHAVRPKWQIIFVHETWWGENRAKAIRNTHWTHLEQGDRRDVLRWFAERETELP